MSVQEVLYRLDLHLLGTSICSEGCGNRDILLFSFALFGCAVIVYCEKMV